jgi:hypothetical protein
MNPSLPVILSEAKNLSGRSRVNSDLIFDMLHLIFDISGQVFDSVVPSCLAAVATATQRQAPRGISTAKTFRVIVLTRSHFRVSVTASTHLPKDRYYAGYEPRQDDTYLARP